MKLFSLPFVITTRNTLRRCEQAMLTASQFFTRHVINGFISLSTFILLIVNFDLGALLVLLATFGSYYISNKITKGLQTRSRSKELGLTTSEMALITQQLKIAKQNIQKLNQQPVKIRSVKSFKQKTEMVKIARRIVGIVQTSPHKFFGIEDFFYAHLPSAVQLTTKYTTLSKQEVKGTDIHFALDETRSTLKELKETFDDDLKLALKDEIETLKIEIDFAKLENERRKERNQIGGDF